MNKIVRSHYPVGKLPADLREGLPPDATVSVRIDVEDSSDRLPLSRLAGTLPNLHGEEGAVIAHFRSLREDE
ncbi:hypothetical protein [Pleomorphomonas carboxyditropha]|uniref:Uncharacterized protein n=1 Tax=Pleomorphomonas carboxyditropha TaxID=2023338 RepID=A0A2G9WU90_9HYPH|nr:hypothetical protein [Pleomorphomonas carboxyditropha]PIO97872.1 hypothetical protein CJ014_18450 [Pleomorphomonas carboxyditropha]